MRTDDAEKINSKSHGPHALNAISAQYKKRIPHRRCGAGQIPSECQVRTFHNSKVLELREIMRTLICKGFGVYIVVEGWHLFLGLEVFSL